MNCVVAAFLLFLLSFISSAEAAWDPAGDTIALLLGLFLAFIGICAFLGWWYVLWLLFIYLFSLPHSSSQSKVEKGINLLCKQQATHGIFIQSRSSCNVRKQNKLTYLQIMCVLWWGRGPQLGDSFQKSSQHSFEEFAIRKEVTPWACCHYCRWWSSSASLHPHKIAMPFPSILLNPHCTLLVLVPFWAVLKYVATRGWVQLANRRYTHECLRRLLTRAIAHRLSAAKARHDFSRTIPHSVIMIMGADINIME